jgi:hypothetical protein
VAAELSGTVLLLVGAKAVGKSWVAGVAEQRLAVHHVDADRLVLERTAAGERPDPVDGWLIPVRQEVLRALAEDPVVSVEATGAWDSDWRLADDLAGAGVRVLRVLVCATEQESLLRLCSRGGGRAPVSDQEAAWIYQASTARTAGASWDAKICTSGEPSPDAVVAALSPLLP